MNKTERAREILKAQFHKHMLLIANAQTTGMQQERIEKSLEWFDKAMLEFAGAGEGETVYVPVKFKQGERIPEGCIYAEHIGWLKPITPSGEHK